MSSIPCILIPLLVGLISAILGYLLGKMSVKPAVSHDSALREELNNCRKKAAQLKSDYDALKSKAMSAPAAPQASNFAAAAPAAPAVAFNADLAQSVMGRKIKQDDLKIVEGIGPKIEELFHAAGIKTWKALSETPVAQCNKILEDAGPRFTVHKADTWPKQCLLAYENKWQELKDWQETLDGGR
jgi:predicted flap endonuclease-1-like 5' DNA nuclease